MSSESLARIFDGWSGYQTSLVNAITPLTPAQLAWRPAAHLRSVGEIARHISFGRLTWFARMDAPGSTALAERIEHWETDSDGNRHVVETAFPITEQPGALVRWLEATWEIIDRTLAAWTTADLARIYRHTWNGDTYAIPNQWTVWRILSHDIHHGGELAFMLGLQGIETFELGDLFGHITLPPLAPAG